MYGLAWGEPSGQQFPFGSGGASTDTELWNGTNWTEVNDLNTARSGLTGFGLVNTAAIAQGSNAIPTGSLTELWNGTSWTEVNNLNSPRAL